MSIPRSGHMSFARSLPRLRLISARRYGSPRVSQALRGSAFSPSPGHRAWKRQSATILAAAATIALVYKSLNLPDAHAESAAPPQEIVIEKSKKKKGASKEESRDLISSQHLQVKKSWENPGVYIWGSNTGMVAAPDSNEIYIKTPRRIPYFDDILLRDIKLDRNFGAALGENGDLIQWGKG